MGKLLRPFPIGLTLMTLSGVGILLYGSLQLVRTLPGWIEFGLTPARLGPVYLDMAFAIIGTVLCFRALR